MSSPIASKLVQLAPPGLKAATRPPQAPPPQPPRDDDFAAEDRGPERDQHRGAKVLIGLGMLAGGLGMSSQAAAAQPAQAHVQMQQTPATEAVHQQMLQGFAREGELSKSTLGFHKQLTPAEALQRLQHEDAVHVRLRNGETEKLRNTRELETLDTLAGQGLHPNLPVDLVRSLRELEQGVTPRDGMFKPGGEELSAYDAYRILSAERDGAGKAAVVAGFVGMAIGLAVVGGGAVLVTKGLVPQVDVQKHNPNLLMGAAVGLVALGALMGAAVGHAQYQAAWPQALEVRNGSDSRLEVRNLVDAVEQAAWLKDQATHPFTPEQQTQALRHLDQHGGVFRTGLGRKRLKPEEALRRLASGKSIELPNPIKPGEFLEIPSLRHLQEYDTMHGLAVNPVTKDAETAALRYLNQRGQFRVKDKRISGYEALDRMLRERQPQQVHLHGKDYTLANFREAQELNALKGDLKNTILPDLEFRAMRNYDAGFREGDKRLDAFEALQGMRAGKPVSAESSGRQARVTSPTDAHELYSLEVSGENTILPREEYDLLQYWQLHGGYGKGRAYEALQSLQSGSEFDVRSERRLAPASSYQDLRDLAAFEGPQNPFRDTVPAGLRDRLEYFQGTHQLAFRVGGREGRAYEGYRQLRDGHGVEVRAGGVWNVVQSEQDLHELDALLGRRVNDILPKPQYDLLHHLGDESRPEGLSRGGARLNSYQSLQVFQAGQHVTYDFVGGDFTDTVSIPVQNLDQLAEAKLRRDNQKEFDKYRYTLPEFKDKMKREEQHLPALAQADLAQGENHLRQGQEDESRGRRHKSDAESDLSRGRSSKSWAEVRLVAAYAMPSEVAVTKWRTVTNTDGTTSQESYTDYEHNWARDAAIASALSDVSSAERQIRQAESDISDAEREIRAAQQEIREAEQEIEESQEILRIAGRLRTQLASLGEGESLTSLRDQVARMRQLAHTSSLQTNLAREAKLIQNQMSRPQRPEGWQVPSPLAQP